LGGCSIKIIKTIIVATFICLLAACSHSKVLPEYINELAKDQQYIKRMTKYEDEGVTAVYAIGNEKLPRMVVQEAEALGFKDRIRVLVLIDVSTGVVNRVKVLKHHETEDYGGYVTEDWFVGRFAGKDAATNLQLVKKAIQDDDDVVAITGATYTSQAVVDAVNMCLENYRKIIKEVDW
jgi:Na+-translocating ferredoxin:NAD+ oxidoreductase RnfG subunit